MPIQQKLTPPALLFSDFAILLGGYILILVKKKLQSDEKYRTIEIDWD